MSKKIVKEFITKKELFLKYAPSFNFELNENQLLVEALNRGFITPVASKDGVYLVNDDYPSKVLCKGCNTDGDDADDYEKILNTGYCYYCAAENQSYNGDV